MEGAIKGLVEKVEELVKEGGAVPLKNETIRGINYRVWASAPFLLRELYSIPDPNRTFLIQESDGKSISFGDALFEAKSVAHQLSSWIKPGDHVALCTSTRIEYVVIYMAISLIGGITSMMGIPWSTREFELSLNSFKPKLLIVDKQRIESISNWLQTNKDNCRVIIVGEGIEQFQNLVDHTYADILQNGRGKEPPFINIDQDALCTVMYTSGTTSSPKGVMHSNRSILSAMLITKLSQKLSIQQQHSQEVTIQTLPLSGVGGLFNIVLTSMLRNRTVILTSKSDPEFLLDMIEKYQITFITGPPSLPWTILSAPTFSSRNISSLREIGWGGGTQTVSRILAYKRAFPNCSFSSCYGSTESCSITVGFAGPLLLAKPESCGLPMINVQVKIVDENNNEVPVGQVGEILIRSPANLMGYWNDEKHTSEVLVDGWFYTGDLGYVDELSFLYFMGRKKDIVKVCKPGVGNIVISCQEVEEVAYAFGGIEEAVVIAKPHPDYYEEVTLVIRPTGFNFEVEDLKTHLVSQLATFKIPSHIYLLNTPLPRNPTGKFLKDKLLKLVLEIDESRSTQI